MKHPNVRALLGIATLFALIGSTLAGETPKTVIAESGWKPGNPMTFANGLLTFDFEERFRFEYRDNNGDFNYVRDTGPADIANFVCVQTQLNF